MNSLTDFFNSPFHKYLLLSCLLGFSADSFSCTINGATVKITTLAGADIQISESVLGPASPGESTAPPLVIVANGSGEITMTVALEFDWDLGPSGAWLHGVSYSNSSGWFGAIGSSPGPEWAAIDNPSAGPCSGNAYDQGFYYIGETQSSVNPVTCDCDSLPALYTEKDPDDPSDNWGTPSSDGEFGFTLKYSGEIGADTVESFTFVITDDGETGGWAQAAGCVFTLNYPVQILDTSSVSTIQLDEVSQTRIFPNPATDHLYLINESTELLQVSIHSMDGKVMETFASPDHTYTQVIDLSRYPAGSYVIRVVDVQGRRKVHQFVVE